MKHLGDITKIHGSAVDSVNVVIGGSPCQDLSIAGKRQGLEGERSGLFMDQLRIIKEMRKADEDRGRTGKDIRPRFMVWENVPGTFSSNKGADFGAVLQETAKVIVKEAPAVPMPAKGWPTAGCIYGMGDGGAGFSIAWRVLDAQFWGVPQRRRRIVLVADFGGCAGPEILFERESVSGDIEAGAEARKRASGDAGNGAVRDDPVLGEAAGFNGWKSVTGSIQYGNQLCPTIEANMPPDVVTSAFSYKEGSKAHGTESVKAIDCRNAAINDELSATLQAKSNGGQSLNCINPVIIPVSECYEIGNGQADQSGLNEVCRTLNCMHDQRAVQVPKVARPLKAKANCDFREDSETYVVEPGSVQKYIVRRLTPLECERLQGYPDGWTDIGAWDDTAGRPHKESTDSARYKALGNSIAIPPWFYVLQRLAPCCGADHTMGSLFDGIGGFPLIWESLNGRGTCLWASEIEEFPIAVTKRHFQREAAMDPKELYKEVSPEQAGRQTR